MKSTLTGVSPGSSATTSYDATVLSLPKISNDELFRAVINADRDRLSSMFEQGQVDLTAIHDAHGQTALHMAIASGHGDIVKMLLNVAHDDPFIVNVLDRQGYTPLMRAAALDDVSMMQDLIHAGATTDNSIKNYRSPPSNRSAQDAAVIKAMVLMAAGGDKTVALQLAVKSLMYGVADLFSNAGANGAQALRHFAEQRDQSCVHVMINRRYADEDDVERVLDYAARAGDVRTATMLIMGGASETELLKHYAGVGETIGLKVLFDAGAVANEAFENILDASYLTKTQKMERFSALLKAGGNADDLLEELGERNDIGAQRMLIVAGAPAVNMLMDLARAGKREAAQAYIRIGVDVATAINELLENDEQSAANVLTMAMAVAVLEGPKPSKPSNMKPPSPV